MLSKVLLSPRAGFRDGSVVNKDLKHVQSVLNGHWPAPLVNRLPNFKNIYPPVMLFINVLGFLPSTKLMNVFFTMVQTFQTV